MHTQRSLNQVHCIVCNLVHACILDPHLAIAASMLEVLPEGSAWVLASSYAPVGMCLVAFAGASLKVSVLWQKCELQSCAIEQKG